MFAAVVALRMGAPKQAVAVAITVVVCGLVGLLEHKVGFRASWRNERPTLDAAHTLLIGGLVGPIVHGSCVALYLAIGLRSGTSGWLADAPLLLQVVLAIVAADFAAYWVHRWTHATGVGWRIHVLHHTSTGLNWLAASRTHPLNAVLLHGAEMAIVLTLGVGPEALTLWVLFRSVNSFLQHANVDFDPGRLSLLLATSDVHRRHHSVDWEQSQTNFGNVTTLWDRLFGTLSLPEPSEPTSPVGVDDYDLPATFGAHMAAPFTLARYERTLEQAQ